MALASVAALHLSPRALLWWFFGPQNHDKCPYGGLKTDAELITLSVMQALLGYTSEARWLRYTRCHLQHLFRYLPGQPGYNNRLRRLGATPTCTISVPVASGS